MGEHRIKKRVEKGHELTASRVLVKSSMLTVIMASFALESSLRDMLIKGAGYTREECRGSPLKEERGGPGEGW